VDTVKDKIETRRIMRRARRFRKTPCRKNKYNRRRGGLPPATRARWQAKLRIINILKSLYSINTYIIEDIKAKTKPRSLFSPLEIGKNWFYSEVSKFGNLILKQGYETKKFRDELGLIKTKSKLKYATNK
jgi:hypothetical protein